MTAVTTTTHHRVLMSDVDLVQVHYARMYLWMDHGFNQLLHDLDTRYRHSCGRGGQHRSSTHTATTSGR